MVSTGWSFASCLAGSFTGYTGPFPRRRSVFSPINAILCAFVGFGLFFAGFSLVRCFVFLTALLLFQLVVLGCHFAFQLGSRILHLEKASFGCTPIGPDLEGELDTLVANVFNLGADCFAQVFDFGIRECCCACCRVVPEQNFANTRGQDSKHPCEPVVVLNLGEHFFHLLLVCIFVLESLHPFVGERGFVLICFEPLQVATQKVQWVAQFPQACDVGMIFRAHVFTAEDVLERLRYCITKDAIFVEEASCVCFVLHFDLTPSRVCVCCARQCLQVAVEESSVVFRSDDTTEFECVYGVGQCESSAVTLDPAC